MGGSRETASLWFWLFEEGKHYKKYKRSFRKLVSSEYFWHDSFGCYINKYLTCKLFGHRNAQWLGEVHNNQEEFYCFSCKTKVGWRWKNLPDDGPRVDCLKIDDFNNDPNK